jgi:biphenyl-2,3-diol 1,2-dioxygenase
MSAAGLLARLAHVALATPDIETSYRFFHDVIGLEEVGRVGEEIHLRAWGDTGHHTLALVPTTGNAYVEHISWRARTREAVEQVAERVGRVTAVRRLPAGSEAGQGDAIRFQAHDRFPFEVFYDRAGEPAGAGGPSPIKTNASSPGVRGVTPRRLDHVNLTCTDEVAGVEWMQRELGFELREYLHRDGKLEAGWMAVSPLPHDVGVGVDPHGKRAGFHHVAFFLDSGSDILRAAEILAENGIEAERGPGRHAISQALFLYVRDPGSGHRVELYTGGYLVLDPDWEPVGWSAESEYRQWWGPELDRLAAARFTETTDCGAA